MMHDDRQRGTEVMDVMAARLHAWAATAWWRARDARGQGTAEYVGMVVMVGV